MTFFADLVTFNVPTGAVGTTIDVSLPNLDAEALAPKVLRARCVGRTDTVDAVGAANIVFSYGFATSTTSRVCFVTQSATGVTPSSSDTMDRNDCIIASLSSTGVANGRLDINSISAGTVQFIIDQQFSSGFTVILSAFAGTSISNVNISTVTLAGLTTGTLDVTTPGFQARYIEGFYTLGGSVNAVSTNSIWGLGRSYLPTAAQHSLANYSQDNVATANTAKYANDTEMLIGYNTLNTTPYVRISAVSALSNGFKINRIEYGAGGSRRAHFLVLGGTFQCAMGIDLTETSTGVASRNDPGFVAVATDIWSHCDVESTTDTAQNTAESSIGWFLGQFGNPQYVQSYIDPDNVSPSAGATSVGFTSVYSNISTAGALEGVGEINGPEVPPPTEWEFEMTDADPSQNFFSWVSFAEVAAAPPATASGGLIRTYRSKFIRGYR